MSMSNANGGSIVFNTEEGRWSWFAAAVDGEGSLGLDKVKGRTKYGSWFSPSLRVSNTSLVFLEEMKKNFGGFILGCSVKHPKCKQQFMYCLKRRNELKDVLESIHPYLIIKREHAELLIDAISLLRNNKHIHMHKERYLNNCNKLDEIHLRIKSLNRRGH